RADSYEAGQQQREHVGQDHHRILPQASRRRDVAYAGPCRSSARPAWIKDRPTSARNECGRSRRGYASRSRALSAAAFAASRSRSRIRTVANRSFELNIVVPPCRQRVWYALLSGNIQSEHLDSSI